MHALFTRLREPLVQRLIMLFMSASLCLMLPVMVSGLLLHGRYSPLALLNAIVPIVAHPGCQDTACDGKDPITEGCDRDATTQASLTMFYSGALGSPLVTNALTLKTGMELGVLERRHSASCGASWARITDSIPALRKGLPATGVSLSGEQALIGEFALAQPSWMPLKTFSGKALAEPGADPLAGILAAMEAVGKGQRIISQLTLVRATHAWPGLTARKAVEHPLQPERDRLMASRQSASGGDESLEGAKLLALILLMVGGVVVYRWYQQQLWFPLILLLCALVFAIMGFCWWKLRQQKTPMYDMKLVAEKMARSAFYAHLRVIVIGAVQTSTQEQLHAHLSAMETVYRQFSLASANSLYLKRTKRLDAASRSAAKLTVVGEAFPSASWLLRALHGGAWSDQVLNALELAGLFHLPQATTDLPLVRRVSLKGLLASPEIARQVQQAAGPLPPALIGYSQHRRHRVPVYVPFALLFSHQFLAGMSRSGKSVLMQLLTQAAMQPLDPACSGTIRQPGVFVADPHRDLILDLLQLVPASRMQDVLLLDMTDTQYPVALNPLDASMGLTRDQAVSNLMSCFQNIRAAYWGPHMAYFLNSVCLLLYTLNERLVQQGRSDEQYTLLDINPLLQYKEYAIQALLQLDMSEVWHQELLAWWQHTYFTLPASSSFRQEVIMPILSKIGVFNDNLQLRRIVGQPVTKAPVHQAITKGKIVLCALAARDMDDAAVNILGSTLINLLHRAFSVQQAAPLTRRRKVFCAVDEFQNFSGSDFDKLLSEDAKYGCAMLLATQNFKRLNKIRDGLLEMVLSNCQNLCVFRVSAADAGVLQEELQEKVTVKHILSQPGLHCYARLAIPGFPQQIVSVALAQPASWQDDPERQRRARTIVRMNQQRNRSASEVDLHYEQHLHRCLKVSAYAARLQREARAAQKSQQQRAAPQSSQEEQQKPHEQSQGTEGEQMDDSSQPEGPQPRPTSPSETGEPAAASAGQQKKAVRNRRNRHRSRHMGTYTYAASSSAPATAPPRQDAAGVNGDRSTAP